MTLSQQMLAAFLGTLLITTLEAGAQQARLTRMSIPYLLGTILTADRDRAKLFGFFVHLLNGQLIALLYGAVFRLLGAATWRVGLSLGVAHAAVVLLLVVPLLPAVHPRMASLSQGPTSLRQLEPPGPLGLFYGWSTPLVVILAHAAFGALLGALFKV